MAKHHKPEDQSDAIDPELQELLSQAEEEAKAKEAEMNKDGDKSGLTATQEMEEKIKQLEEQILRMQAEFVNFRTRNEKDRLDFVKYAAKNTLLELLPVLDYFYLALKHTPDHLKNDNWAIGVQYVASQFESTLEKLGVKKIQTVGYPVNYNEHEAIASVPGAKDMIIGEIEAGYKLHEHVIRVAKVEVGNGEEPVQSTISAD